MVSPLEAMDEGDLDGDGDIDVALVTETATLVLWNSSTGSLSASESILLVAEPSDLSIADVDGDGGLDLVVSHDDVTRPIRASIFRNAGNGRF